MTQPVKASTILLFLLPCAVGGFCAAGYAFKLLSVFPPGKESWIEEGLYSMAFHATCLTIVLPLFIMVIVRNWQFFQRWWSRLLIIVSMLISMMLIVILPEIVVNKVHEKRSSCVDAQGHWGP